MTIIHKLLAAIYERQADDSLIRESEERIDEENSCERQTRRREAEENETEKMEATEEAIAEGRKYHEVTQ